MNLSGTIRIAAKAGAALLLGALMLGCLCVFTATPVHAAEEIFNGTDLAELSPATYEMDEGTYSLSKDMTGDYCFEIPAGIRVTVNMNGHVIDGGDDSGVDDFFEVGKGAKLVMEGGGTEADRNKEHTARAWTSYVYNHIILCNDEYSIKVKGPGLLNCDHGVYVKDNASVELKGITIAGLRQGGVYVNGDGSTVKLEDSTIRYNSHVGLTHGAVHLNGDNDTLQLYNCIIRDCFSDDGEYGNIWVEGDNCKVLGDPEAEGDARGCISNSRDEHPQHCNVRDSGGGLYIDGDDCEVAYLRFHNCQCYKYGGAIYVDGDNLNIHDVEFTDNKSYVSRFDSSYDTDRLYGQGGGALCVDGKNALIRKCSFVNNNANGQKGGGGALLYGSGHKVQDCDFSGNSTIYRGTKGKLSGTDGGAILIKSTDTEVSDCRIENNSAGERGAGIASYASGTRVIRCKINYNSVYGDTDTSEERGGGIYFNEENTYVSDCEIRGNRSGERYLDRGVGGGIYYQDENNVLENTVVEHNNCGTMEAKGIYVDNEDLTLKGTVVVRNNNNEAGWRNIPCWSNLYLRRNSELNIEGGKLGNNSEVWIDSKWGREDDPTGGYIYHDEDCAPINRYGLYADRFGYSFIEKNGTLYYKQGADYPKVTIAAPTLSLQPKSQGEKWNKYPGKVYINTDPSYGFSKGEKQYEITRSLPDGSPESVEYQTDEKGDYVDLDGKNYTYTLSLYNTVTINTPEGEQTLGTSATTTAEYALNIPYERSKVSVQVGSEDGEYFEEIGKYSAGDEVTADTHVRISPVGKEPYSWTLEYHQANTAEGETKTIENFNAVYNKKTRTVSFTMPEDVDGGETKLRRVNGVARYKMTYKAYPAACASLLPHEQDDPNDHVVTENYDTMLELKPIDAEVDGTMYYTEAIMLDGELLPIDGKTVKVIEDHEISYIFTKTEPKRSCAVTYDLTGTGLTAEGLYSNIKINETYKTGQTFLETHSDKANANKADYYGSSLVIDHFQVGVADGSGGMTFSEDNVLGLDDPVTDDMTLRMIVVPAFRGQISNQRGGYFKPDGDNETYTRTFTAGDSIEVGIRESYKFDEYKNKVVDYWQVTRSNYVNSGYPQIIGTVDEVKADGQAVKQNADAAEEAYYSVSENSISVPLTKDMAYPNNINKLVTVSVVPSFKDPVTNITGVPDTMEEGDSWNPETAVVWPESVKGSPVTWKVLSSSGRKTLEDDFTPAKPGKYTLEATVKDGLGLTKDYTQNFEITVTGNSPEHKVSFDVAANDEIDPPLDQYVIEGSAVNKPTDPKWEGHAFDGWYVTVNNEEQLYDFNSPVVSDLKLKAHWKQLYTVTAAVTPENDAHGTVSISGEKTDGKYKEGSTVTFIAVPDNDYKVKCWFDNGQEIEDNTTGVYSIDNLDSGHTVTVEFETATPVATHKVAVHSIGYADKVTVNANGEPITSDGYFTEGEAVTLEAIPEKGYVSRIGWYEGKYLENPPQGMTDHWMPKTFLSSANPYTFATGNKDLDLVILISKEIKDIELTSASEIQAGSTYTPAAIVQPEDDYPNPEIKWKMVSCPEDTKYVESDGIITVTNAGSGGTMVLKATYDNKSLDGVTLATFSKEFAIKVSKATVDLHTVTFKNGDTVVATKRVADSTRVESIGSITKSGSRFDGWFYGETLYDFTQSVTENLTLTAGWTKATHVNATVTCTEAGKIGHYEIGSGSGTKYYTDEYMLNEVDPEDLESSALGHMYGEWKYFNANQHWRTCERDSSHIEYENHSWDDGEVTTQPTATTEGVKTFTCTACGTKKTEKIPPTGGDSGGGGGSEAVVDADVQKVADMISNLPDQVTVKDAAAIKAAREAYDSLSDEQKKDPKLTEALKKLTDAEEALRGAQDREAAGEVSNAIAAIPEIPEDSTREQIRDIRDAYEALPDSARELIGHDELLKLEKAEYFWASTDAKAVRVTVKTAKAKKHRKALVTWKKTPDAAGYQIAYSTSKKFTKKKTKKVYVGAEATTKTLKNLKAGRRYYVKVTPYTSVYNPTKGAKENIYGRSSKVKKVRARR